MADSKTQRAYHDVGGLDLGEIPLDVGEYELWEKRVDAMLRLVSSKAKLMRVDELRRGIETLGEATYDKEPYYGKWARSIAKIMVEKGVLTQAEIDKRVEEIRNERGL